MDPHPTPLFLSLPFCREKAALMLAELATCRPDLLSDHHLVPKVSLQNTENDLHTIHFDPDPEKQSR